MTIRQVVRWATLGLIVIVAAVVLVKLVMWVVPRDEADDEPNPNSPLKVVALGDSFMSGEGARSFIRGTNVLDVNLCRRATTAYPALLAKDLHARLVFAACSGARVKDVIQLPDDPKSSGQYEKSPSDVIGGLKQIEVLRQHADANIVLISLGGNDVEFAKTVQECVLGAVSCVANAGTYMGRVQALYKPLLSAYRQIRQTAPHATVFAVTYPMPFGPTPCRFSLFGSDEFRFVDEFVTRLNEVIAFTGSMARINVIDAKNAFVSRRICEVRVRDAAINVLAIGRPHGAGLDVRTWLRGGFHPNAVGHRMLATLITKEVRKGLGRGNPPEGPPTSEPLPTEPPPHVPSVQGPPTGPYQFPTGAPCKGPRIAYVLNRVVSADVKSQVVPLDQLRPSSLVCFRSYHGDWSGIRVPDDGRVRIRINFENRHGLGSLHEILAQDNGGYWTRILFRRK
jgi:lysophospholipase L1-like esterase